MDIKSKIESYRLPQIIELWAEERLIHENLITQELANAIINEGLRAQSVDEKWCVTETGSFEMKNQPYVGYVAVEGNLPIIIRASAFKHLSDICNKGNKPDTKELFDEIISREDFKTWLLSKNYPLPRFWYI